MHISRRLHLENALPLLGPLLVLFFAPSLFLPLSSLIYHTGNLRPYCARIFSFSFTRHCIEAYEIMWDITFSLHRVASYDPIFPEAFFYSPARPSGSLKKFVVQLQDVMKIMISFRCVRRCLQSFGKKKH